MTLTMTGPLILGGFILIKITEIENGFSHGHEKSNFPSDIIFDELLKEKQISTPTFFRNIFS